MSNWDKFGGYKAFHKEMRDVKDWKGEDNWVYRTNGDSQFDTKKDIPNKPREDEKSKRGSISQMLETKW